MKADFVTSQHGEHDHLLIARGEGYDWSVTACVSITGDDARITQVNILASAGNSCFRSVRCVGGIAYIGFGRFVFVVDISRNDIRRHELDGYFGHLYDTSDLEHLDDRIAVLAASASELLAFDRTGNLLWKQSGLGIDGVVLHHAGLDRIGGEGEWDPPGGWRPFTLIAQSGERLESESFAGWRP
ncbi:hypothetical protein OU994_26100 [Pseudoduganella sp. SL102]|uniref:hypothetical protein n=1 Tax=Pseudoduganella sp. SL102 TaxID=2995154 RepID=UPI00248CCCC8|nr:hypothetical protein [Pseudoduganella sp. SL102]WBS01701.1 hypothetical protein OU994_26100 [Pseudoduganella sp. SL102]